MPRKEFSLRERVYIHNTYYMKSRTSCYETRRKFWVKFPGGSVRNPSTIRRQAKRFKETGSVKNRNVNRRCHVLTEETLDEIGKRLKHTLQKSLRCLPQETEVSVSSTQRATTLLKLHILYVLWIHTRSHNENSCLGMSQIAIIPISTLTALTYNYNHNQKKLTSPLFKCTSMRVTIYSENELK